MEWKIDNRGGGVNVVGGWTGLRRRREKRMVSPAWYLDLREKREMVVSVGRRWGGWWRKTIRYTKRRKLMVISVEDDGGSESWEDDGGFCTRKEERKKRGVVYLQQWPYFKVEKSKLPIVSILFKKSVSIYHFSYFTININLVSDKKICRKTWFRSQHKN